MNIKEILILIIVLSIMIFIFIAGINYINSKQRARMNEHIEKIEWFNNKEANFRIKMKTGKCVIFPRHSDLLVMSEVLDKNHCIIINP